MQELYTCKVRCHNLVVDAEIFTLRVYGGALHIIFENKSTSSLQMNHLKKFFGTQYIAFMGVPTTTTYHVTHHNPPVQHHRLENPL